MKRVLLVLVYLAMIIPVSSQTKGVVYESHFTEQNGKFRSLAYKRTLGTGQDNEYGFYYKTQYDVFDKYAKPVITINVVNYKAKGVVEIYIFPYYNGNRQDNLVQYYVIDANKFDGLTYEQKSILDQKYYNKDNTLKKVVEIKYFSNKKENIVLKQIDSKIVRVHYKFEN